MITTEIIRKIFSLSATGATFGTTFKVIDASHLVVTVTRDSDGSPVSLTKDADYIVTGVGDDNGADIQLTPYETANNITDWSTYDDGPWTLTVTLSIPVTQIVDYVINGTLSSQNIEDSLDKLTQIALLNRQGSGGGAEDSLNIQFPDVEPSTTSNKLPLKDDRLGKLAAWNATTGEFEAVSLNTTGSGMQGPATQVDDRLALFSATTDLLKDDADISASLFRPQTLVYGGIVNWDSALGHIATLNLSGDPTLNVTNIKAGSYKLLVNQDVTGGRTITFNTGFGNTSSVTLNTDASALTVLTFTSDGTTVYYEGSSQAAVSSAGDVGTYRWFAYDISSSEDDVGYLICNGQAVSRTKYADLFAALGVSYGIGDGSTTFNLPDLTTDERFIRSSTTAGTTQASTVLQHSHGGDDNGWFVADDINYSDTAYYIIASANNGNFNLPNDSNGDSTSITTAVRLKNGGSDTVDNTGAAESRPRNISAIPAIKF